MESWQVWEELNRLLMLSGVVRFAAFEIRDAVTPMHGIVQVMLAECRDEQEGQSLHLLFMQLQGVGSLLKEMIAAHAEELHKAEQSALAAGRRQAYRVAELHASVKELHQVAVDWQVTGDSKRVQAILPGMAQANKLCVRLMELI